jgi:hypothetical protein
MQRRFVPAALLPLILSAAALPAQDAEMVLRSYQHTYPERVGKIEWKNGDWTIEAGSETFYWAGGRLLPEGLRGEEEKWLPHSFGVYPAAVPSPGIYSPDYIEALRAQGAAGAEDREDRHRGFEAALYGGAVRAEIEKHMVPVSFLGHRVVVHRDITAALKRVEAAILGAGDREVEDFVRGVGQVGAYNWRAIRGSRRMSCHSWGLAVDILPKKRDGRAIYWLWERARNEDWMLVPPEARWSPPGAVIRAFENEGFIWGGKWALYDNMHFEYRPELHEINRILAAQSGEEERPRAPVGGGPDLHHLYPRGIHRAAGR